AVRATSYLRLGIYEFNQRDVRGQWAAILNDITDVTGDVFLGLGVSCARCHDHKFDPILQRDYYRLQAFFAALELREDPVFDSAAHRADYQRRLAEWEKRTAGVRKQLDDMLRPLRERDGEQAIAKFPEDLQPIFRKPAKERTPLERQLFDLAYRQVTIEHE